MTVRSWMVVLCAIVVTLVLTSCAQDVVSVRPVSNEMTCAQQQAFFTTDDVVYQTEGNKLVAYNVEGKSYTLSAREQQLGYIPDRCSASNKANNFYGNEQGAMIPPGMPNVDYSLPVPPPRWMQVPAGPPPCGPNFPCGGPGYGPGPGGPGYDMGCNGPCGGPGPGYGPGYGPGPAYGPGPGPGPGYGQGYPPPGAMNGQLQMPPQMDPSMMGPNSQMPPQMQMGPNGQQQVIVPNTQGIPPQQGQGYGPNGYNQPPNGYNQPPNGGYAQPSNGQPGYYQPRTQQQQIPAQQGYTQPPGQPQQRAYVAPQNVPNQVRPKVPQQQRVPQQ